MVAPFKVGDEVSPTDPNPYGDGYMSIDQLAAGKVTRCEIGVGNKWYVYVDGVGPYYAARYSGGPW